MSIGMLFGTSAFAEAQGKNDIPELPSIEVKGLWSAHNLTAPVAVKVLRPVVQSEMVGIEVRMLLRISEKGRPGMIHSHASPFDDGRRNLAAIMRTALEAWEFSPAYNKEGQPVEVKVALPVRVVEQGNGNAGYYAHVAIAEPILLAVLDR